jgi:hypothetical protein
MFVQEMAGNYTRTSYRETVICANMAVSTGTQYRHFVVIGVERLKTRIRGCGLDSFGPGYGSLAGSCKWCNAVNFWLAERLLASQRVLW